MPLAALGTRSTTTTCFGALNDARCALVWAISSPCSVGVERETTATTRLPNVSSGRPTTRQSSTAGWVFTTSSTSSANTFSPPVLTTWDPRPSSVILPSGSTVAQSPGKLNRTPSTSRNVAAVLSGSL